MDQKLGMQCDNGASLTDQALFNLEIYGMGAFSNLQIFLQERRGLLL